MTKSTIAVVSALALTAFGLNSCDTYTGQGAGIGAASGAVIGAAATGNLRGAAIGAGAGALAGALVGAAISDEEARRYGPPPEGGYPRARWGSTMGYVTSPCAPHNTVDVRGIPPGALVRDPSSGCIFRRP
jgi:predicted small secreted protein